MNLPTKALLAALPLTVFSVDAAVVTSTKTPVAAWYFSFNGNTDNSWTGDFAHADGLQFTGFTDPWQQLRTRDDEQSVASNGVTFHWNVGNAELGFGGWFDGGGAGAPRKDHADPLAGTVVPFRFEGLTPGTAYDIILNNSGQSIGNAIFTIDGFDAGNGVGNPVTLDTEGDGNFQDVVADANGYISGTFGASASRARLSSLQIAEGNPIPEPASGMMILAGLGALGMRRRRK